MSLTIAVDAMGGDDAPSIVLEGTELALAGHELVGVILFGDEAVLRPQLENYPRLKAAAVIHHTDEAVKSDDAPGQAVRRGRNSSMGLAIKAVHDGEAQVVISAGNTGALMGMSMLTLRTMEGIDRPALATSLPTVEGHECVVLDLGANVECSPASLAQFAIMGAGYARTVLGVETPRVGLVNIGTEAIKGNEAVKAADEILHGADILKMDYAGFVEGDAVTSGSMDVVVLDGYSGNIALKTLEGTVRLLVHKLRESYRATWYTKIVALLSRPVLARLREAIDPGRYNGAVMLGLNGLVVKSHGSADAASYAAAVGVAVQMAEADLCSKIAEDLKGMGPHREPDIKSAVN